MFLHFAPSENCYRINVLYFIPFFSVLQTVTFTTIKPKNNFLQTVTHLPHFFPISLIYLAIGIPDRFPERTLPRKNAAKSGDMELVDTLYVSGASAVFIWSLIPLPFNLEQNKYPKFTFDGLGVTLFWLQRAVHRLHFYSNFTKPRCTRHMNHATFMMIFHPAAGVHKLTEKIKGDQLFKKIRKDKTWKCLIMGY